MGEGCGGNYAEVPSQDGLPTQQLFVEDIVNERPAQPVTVVEPTVTVEVAPPRKKS